MTEREERHEMKKIELAQLKHINKRAELRCTSCGKWFMVDIDLYNRYLHEGDDYQCEECWYEQRNRFYDNCASDPII